MAKTTPWGSFFAAIIQNGFGINSVRKNMPLATLRNKHVLGLSSDVNQEAQLNYSLYKSLCNSNNCGIPFLHNFLFRDKEFVPQIRLYHYK